MRNPLEWIAGAARGGGARCAAVGGGASPSCYARAPRVSQVLEKLKKQGREGLGMFTEVVGRSGSQRRHVDDEDRRLRWAELDGGVTGLQLRSSWFAGRCARML